MVSHDGQDPQVVSCAATRMKRGVLEHRAHTGAGLVELVVAQAAERGGPRRRLHQPEQPAQRRALPGPVRSEEPRDATGLDVEREVTDGGDGAEVLGGSRILTAARPGFFGFPSGGNFFKYGVWCAHHCSSRW